METSISTSPRCMNLLKMLQSSIDAVFLMHECRTDDHWDQAPLRLLMNEIKDRLPNADSITLRLKKKDDGYDVFMVSLIVQSGDLELRAHHPISEIAVCCYETTRDLMRNTRRQLNGGCSGN